MQTAGVLVSTLAELTAGVQVGEHELHGRNAELRVHIHRNTTAVVNHGNGTALVNLDDDLAAVSGQMLVNRVIQHFEHTVMQTTFIRVTNVHTRTLTHGFEPLQLVNLGGAVLLLCPGRKLLSVLRGRYVITHKCRPLYARTRAPQYISASFYQILRHTAPVRRAPLIPGTWPICTANAFQAHSVAFFAKFTFLWHRGIMP